MRSISLVLSALFLLNACQETITESRDLSFEVSTCLRVGEELSCVDRLNEQTLESPENACLVMEVVDLDDESLSERFVFPVNFDGQDLSFLSAAEDLLLSPGQLFSADLYFYANDESSERPECLGASYIIAPDCTEEWCALKLSQPKIALQEGKTTVRFRDGRGACLIDGPACQELTCDDNVKNGAETDVDCGGPCRDFQPCTDLQNCAVNEDCISLLCEEGVCQVASCSDGIQNGDEIGIDCGSPTRNCGPCTFTTVAGEYTQCRNDNDCEGDSICSRNSDDFLESIYRSSKGPLAQQSRYAKSTLHFCTSIFIIWTRTF